MTTDAVTGLVQVLSSGGLLAGFVIFIGLLMSRKLVMGWVHEAVIEFYKAQIKDMQDRHAAEIAAEQKRTLEWQDIAIKGIKAFGSATTVAEVLASASSSTPTRTGQ